MNLIEAAARNQAAWADKQIRAHGLKCRHSDSLWTSWEYGPATGIHPQAITLRPGTALMPELEAFISSQAGHRLEVVDWWMELDLALLGFRLVENEWEPSPYLLCEADGPLDVVPRPELVIARVATAQELTEFEVVSALGFGVTGKHQPGSWHAPSSLSDPDMRYYLGSVDGTAVSASIAVVSDGLVGIYGVATIPRYRRRGYGAALTAAAVASDRSLPAVLGPSEMGESMYRRMGFGDFHRFRKWRRIGD